MQKEQVTRPGAVQAPRAVTRLLRGGAWAVLGVLAAWVVGWLALPPLLQSQAEQRLSALLGRPVLIRSVDVAPWALSVTVHDLRIGTAGGSPGPDTLHIGRLHADLAASTLWRRAPVVEALQVERPVLHIARLPGGGLDIDDIAARLAPAPGDTPSSSPARFALYNLELNGGGIHIDDRPSGVRHEVQDLQLALPFLSNLKADVAVKVQPRLAFRVDGSSFDSGAAVLPFAQVRSGQLVLRVHALELARWTPYLPAGIALRPTGGRLSADITADFALDAGAEPRLDLRGHLQIADLTLASSPDAAPTVAWRDLQLELQQLQPLQRRAQLGSLRLAGLQVLAERDAQGRLHLPGMRASTTHPATSDEPAPPWQVRLDQLQLTDGSLQWRDAGTHPAAALALTGIDFSAGPLDSAALADVPWRLAARLSRGDGSAPASLAAEGRAGLAAASSTFELQSLDLALLAPYVGQQLAVPVAGTVGLAGGLAWSAGPQPRLAADIRQLRVDQLRVGTGDAAAGLGSLLLTDGRADLLARRLSIGSLVVAQPRLGVARAADGTLDIARWLKTAPSTTATEARPPWQLMLDQLQVSGGRLRWADDRPATPVRLQLDDLHLQASAVGWPSRPGAAPARLAVRARLRDMRPAAEGSPAAEPGRIDWRGVAAADPVLARGDLRVERLPLHAVAPYVQTGLQLLLSHADADWRGPVSVQQRPDGWQVQADGDARLADVQVQALGRDGSAGDTLLNWQSLQLARLSLRMAPGSAPAIDIGEATLADFYSRLVITEEGRFNLRDVASRPQAADMPPAVLPAAEVASAPAAGAAPVSVSIGGTRLLRGRIDFSDRFIRPNYSAALSELNGSIGAFRAGSAEMAALSLQGRVAGTALLDISGAINPTAQPLAMDLRARATDLELSPFSPYAGRYAGYAIERGKLSMDVAYRITPDGRLDASNRVVLNQLTFGERVESPDATKLPVTLAIALLKDRHGVIDLDLPLTGSVNDPQFSVFSLVWKVLGNLLVKAVTAPFSLLAGGGGTDLSTVAFLPGRDTLAPGTEAALDKLAQALADRPALQLTIRGSSDAEAEREALRAALLQARLLEEHHRRAGPAARAPTLAEEEALLRRVYADTRLPDKPRNFVGLAKSLPAPDMAARLQAAMVVTDDQARELAMRRGAAVRDALLARGVPGARLFLAAPRLGSAAPAAGSETAEAAGPGPHAQLVLSPR